MPKKLTKKQIREREKTISGASALHLIRGKKYPDAKRAVLSKFKQKDSTIGNKCDFVKDVTKRLASRSHTWEQISHARAIFENIDNEGIFNDIHQSLERHGLLPKSTRKNYKKTEEK